MNKEKSKNKKKQLLPATIQYSVIICNFFASILVSLAVMIILATNIKNAQNIGMAILILCPPIIGFFGGWWVKFRYANKQGDTDLLLRFRQQLWGTLAFFVAMVISLLLMLIVLILFEQNNALPETLADPITFIIAMLILAISVWVGNNTKNRVYRNFNQG